MNAGKGVGVYGFFSGSTVNMNNELYKINHPPYEHWRIIQFSTKTEPTSVDKEAMYAEFEWRPTNKEMGMKLREHGRLDDVVAGFLLADQKYVPGFNFKGASIIVKSTNLGIEG